MALHAEPERIDPETERQSAQAYRRDQQASHQRTLARLRGESVERSPEQKRADVVVDEMWVQLCAESEFVAPGPLCQRS